MFFLLTAGWTRILAAKKENVILVEIVNSRRKRRSSDLVFLLYFSKDKDKNFVNEQKKNKISAKRFSIRSSIKNTSNRWAERVLQFPSDRNDVSATSFDEQKLSAKNRGSSNDFLFRSSPEAIRRFSARFSPTNKLNRKTFDEILEMCHELTMFDAKIRRDASTEVFRWKSALFEDKSKVRPWLHLSPCTSLLMTIS